MRELLQITKDFKIIPNNFKNSGTFEIKEITEEEIIINVNLLDNSELADYKIGSSVEIFGVNYLGLLYFETKILNVDNNKITLAMTPDYSIIQRREYSRVELRQGSVEFADMPSGIIESIEDISAGGIKLILNQPLEIEKHYDISIKLSNNMKINCILSPIRVKEIDYKDKKAYSISGKFVDLENEDRIILIQYTFKIKMENQNKEEN